MPVLLIVVGLAGICLALAWELSYLMTCFLFDGLGLLVDKLGVVFNVFCRFVHVAVVSYFVIALISVCISVAVVLLLLRVSAFCDCYC